MVAMNRPMYREDHDMAEEGREHWERGGNGQNGNVSQFLNQIQKELAIMDEELGGLANRLKAITVDRPSPGEMDAAEADAMPILSPLAETIQLILGQVRRANGKIRDIKLGVDL